MDKLKEEHDELLANKPDSMSDEDYASFMEEHKESCPFCNENANEEPTEGGDMDKQFTQEELDAAVEAAVAPIKTELESLKDSAEQSEVDARVAEAKAEGDTKVAEIQEQLDAAVLNAETVKTELDDLKAYLESEKEAAELAELFEARKAERKAQIEEVASFPEDYLTANLDRWCEKDDEEFAQLIEDWKVTAKKEDDSESDQAFRDTAIKNVRDAANKGDSTNGDLKNIFGARTAGIKIKNL